MDWFYEFPEMGRSSLRALKKAIDSNFREFTREYGELMEQIFEPLKQFLIFSENLLTQSPWPLVILAIAGLAWLASRSTKIAVGTIITLLLIGYFGMWEDTMRTVSMIFVCTIVAIVLGLPIGVLMSRYDGMQRVVNPTLDVMQTMPSFVYLIPVVMLLGIGKVPGLLAVVIYAIPPIIRFTNLGIRLVPADVLEASEAFGTSAWQKMSRVQLPLALPTIMAGVNQTIMLSLAMVVVASMIGVQGLGQPVLKAIANQYFTLGMFNGLAIVGIAIIFDRASQAYGKRLQRHLEVVHG
ncbi:proline/glycine betaine ABC transporter permease [Burkholderiaceae bacterium]|jgi:glycine betaine/proline transport system permease protein|nr:proline/glycine betaine ABC transporter permease [Betaproteobacteria bacterium]MDA8600459.1 proline/glycine betaine ABC transporter permease [Burkholderiaceae bacterium]MCH9847496.1 proline/glycine betaine ABC transporter permease [Betaproteobacteria bacterium]MDA9885306.1 proline/glycine betaine ABC transporter permease [Burkholderiaceae bacterium]MDB9778447.1 proline/glycine betaine ABC transporter permease [Burkholderiaceae bacterium]|tara:strand:- start:2118 stop:3005 length:888 start_codon:yes stop_codon:yes gene_type:complete